MLVTGAACWCLVPRAGVWCCVLVSLILRKACFFPAATDFVVSVWQLRPLFRAKFSKTARSKIKTKSTISKELR